MVCCSKANLFLNIFKKITLKVGDDHNCVCGTTGLLLLGSFLEGNSGLLAHGRDDGDEKLHWKERENNAGIS